MERIATTEQLRTISDRNELRGGMSLVEEFFDDCLPGARHEVLMVKPADLPNVLPPLRVLFLANVKVEPAPIVVELDMMPDELAELEGES